MQLLSKPFLFMFDPYHIGPGQSTSYDRNNGRVIRRRVINIPSRSWTRNELMELVPLMKMNGLLPSGPTGALKFNSISYSNMEDSLDISGVLRQGGQVTVSYWQPVIFYYSPGNGLLYYYVGMDATPGSENVTFHTDLVQPIVFAYSSRVISNVIDIMFSTGSASVTVSASATRYEDTNYVEISSFQWNSVPWDGPAVP